jgi:hypothetical protein
MFEIDKFSAISHVVVVLVEKVIPHVGSLIVMRRLAYTICNRNFFLLSTGN